MKIDIKIEETGKELKGCPFCGGAGVLTHTWNAAYWVECEECRAQRDDQIDESLDSETREDHLKSAKAACDAWNERA